MQIDTSAAVSMAEAQQNFSKVTSLVDRLGQVIIFQEDTPRYLVLNFPVAEETRFAFDHEVRSSSMKLMEKFDDAFKELAK